MKLDRPSQIPPCNYLLWVVLLVSVLFAIKKYVELDTAWNISEKKFGLFIGFGIILFGLIFAWLRKSSNHVM